MTLNEKCNINPNTPYNEKIKKYIELLGYENIKECMPFNLTEIKTALQNKDVNFKTLPLWLWEYGAGFKNDQPNPYIGSKLTELYIKNGVDTFSCTEGVCILKMTAFLWGSEP